MNFDQAIVELESKLPGEVIYHLDRHALRGPICRDGTRERANRFTLTIGLWAKWDRTFEGGQEKLGAAVGAALDRVRTWQDTGVMPAACERCQDSGRDPKDGGTCDCRIPF